MGKLKSILMKSIKTNWQVLLVCIACFLLGAFISEENKIINKDDLHHAQKLIGIDFTQDETDSMMQLVSQHERNYENMRKVKLPNAIPPAYNFNPLPSGKTVDKIQKPFKTSDYSSTVMPANKEELAFYSIGQLAYLIRTKKISSVQLTQFFMQRLKKYAFQLHCVITFTDTLALQQAYKADVEISAGKYRGILHGIPFGIKDMFATKNYPTTFGSPPYQHQLLDEDATVVIKLRAAGAVMLAKLSLGELAMDDVWFGGLTRNPWDTTKGSSGSSAGPACSVSAGLLPFAIGSETWDLLFHPQLFAVLQDCAPHSEE